MVSVHIYHTPLSITYEKLKSSDLTAQMTVAFTSVKTSEKLILQVQFVQKSGKKILLKTGKL